MESLAETGSFQRTTFDVIGNGDSALQHTAEQASRGKGKAPMVPIRIKHVPSQETMAM